MSYTKEVIERVRTRNSGEPEFIQAVEEVFFTLDPVLKKHPEWIKANILERITEPERQIMFRVPWTDDEGKLQVNRGYRVQFSGAIGPYKGGLRFHDSLNLGTVKFLGFEQIFKNSLTGLPIGGGKGGSDFSPLGKSDSEIMRFCQSFMTELYRHIGPDIDIPAGDIGVGGKEIGYLYGQYRRIRGSFENGTITGKGIPYGGSHVRPEATGYGIVYFANEILKHQGENFEGKTVALSGFGNVTWGTCLKIRDLGGKVVTISGPDGYVYDPEGITTDEKIDFILEMRSSGRDIVKDYADKFGVEFFPKEKPWGVKVDIVIPCATQNEISIEDAKKIVKNKVKFIIEGSNMPTTNEAIAYLQENSVIVGPAKAANAGGVATSALEMCQNSMRISWNEEEVDKKLMDIMINIHNTAANASEKYGFGYNLVAGANIAGFEKVADAMISQGDY
ncbi:NADP-specific glutamate dehydrogenase [uncultured Ilyobacter sp.]|uniref:NADP-specific glutamate dehydrogenase n=1 Tax=uncultured Ilyobacter sp. TaxID=544433 RepID=UPI0029C0E7A5|nr:NADP-specific glutamate dehydrogenase [uncultured Ilyobacter sp.]